MTTFREKADAMSNQQVDVANRVPWTPDDGLPVSGCPWPIADFGRGRGGHPVRPSPSSLIQALGIFFVANDKLGSQPPNSGLGYQ